MILNWIASLLENSVGVFTATYGAKTAMKGIWSWLRRGDPGRERGAYRPVKLSELARPPHWKPSKTAQIIWYATRTNRVFSPRNGARPWSSRKFVLEYVQL